MGAPANPTPPASPAERCGCQGSPGKAPGWHSGWFCRVPCATGTCVVTTAQQTSKDNGTSASHCLIFKIGKPRLGGARPLSRAGGRFWSWFRTGRAREKMRCWRRAQVRCGGAQPVGQWPRVRPALGVTAGDVTGHSPGGLHQGHVPCQVPRSGDRVTAAGGRWWETAGACSGHALILPPELHPFPTC